MFIDVDEYVHTLCEMNLTANQFLLCYLLYSDEKIEGHFSKGKNNSPIANLYKYASNNKGAIKWTKEEIRDICDKGYLKDPHYKSKDTLPDDLVVTEKFKEKIFIRSNHFKEFWEAYPMLVPNFVNVRGPSIKLKVCDPEKLEEYYLKKIRSKALHRKIMEILKWAVENEKLNVNIVNFVKSEQWKAFEQEMEQESSNLHVAR